MLVNIYRVWRYVVVYGVYRYVTVYMCVCGEGEGASLFGGCTSGGVFIYVYLLACQVRVTIGGLGCCVCDFF